MQPATIYAVPAANTRIKPRKQPLPIYSRAPQLRRYTPTERDTKIPLAIYEADGQVLADFHVQRMFFSGKTQMQLRTKLLYQHGYISRPDRKRRYALNSMVYYNDEQGAQLVAQATNTPLNTLKWRSEPRWAWLEHDLHLTTFRLDVIQAAQQHPELRLKYWLTSNVFHTKSGSDSVTFSTSQGQQRRTIRLDGFFAIHRGQHKHPSRFAVELDMATEDNPRIAREKLLAARAYLQSKEYAQRFGFNSGRWLIVTTGQRRLQNMKHTAERILGKDAAMFYYTTQTAHTAATVLTRPIWYQAGAEKPVPLFKGFL